MIFSIRRAATVLRRTFIVADTDPNAPAEAWPENLHTARAILIAIPLSALLWWGIFEIVKVLA